MDFLRFVLLVATVSIAAPACKHPLGPALTDFGQCLAQGVSAQVNEELGAVESALAAPSYDQARADLTALVKQWGAVVIDCAVHQVLGLARAKHASAPSDQLSATKIDNAQRWLSRG